MRKIVIGPPQPYVIRRHSRPNGNRFFPLRPSFKWSEFASKFAGVDLGHGDGDGGLRSAAGEHIRRAVAGSQRRPYLLRRREVHQSWCVLHLPFLSSSELSLSFASRWGISLAAPWLGPSSFARYDFDPVLFVQVPQLCAAARVEI